MTMTLALLLQDDLADAAAGGALLAVGGAFFFIMLAVCAVVIAGFWKVFTKAGHPGWAAIIPIYNMYILTQIAGRPGWWVLLMILPFVNIVIGIIIAIDIAKAFGQSPVFGIVLLFLLAGIGYLVLGFGNYKYIGPVTAPTTA